MTSGRCIERRPDVDLIGADCKFDALGLQGFLQLSDRHAAVVHSVGSDLCAHFGRQALDDHFLIVVLARVKLGLRNAVHQQETI